MSAVWWLEVSSIILLTIVNHATLFFKDKISEKDGFMIWTGVLKTLKYSHLDLCEGVEAASEFSRSMQFFAIIWRKKIAQCFAQVCFRINCFSCTKTEF